MIIPNVDESVMWKGDGEVLLESVKYDARAEGDREVRGGAIIAEGYDGREEI